MATSNSHWNTDAAIYVAIAVLQSIQTMEHWRDPKSWVGVVLVGLVAWKTKRSVGKSEGSPQE